MNNPIKKWLRLAFTAIPAACGAYVLAARWMGFIGASRQDKLIYLAAGLLISGLLSYLLLFQLAPRFLHGLSRRNITRAGVTSVFMAGFSLLLFFKPPPFPENHTLDITVLGTSNPLSAGQWVQVVSIETFRIPEKTTVTLVPSELDLQGDWLIHSGGDLLWQGGVPGTANYQFFYQGGMQINYLIGPEQGMLKVSWDGTDHILDLYSSQEAIRLFRLPAPLNWQKADSTRKLFLLAYFLAEFISLTAIIFTLTVFCISKIQKNQPVLRYPQLLLRACTVLTLVFIFTSLLVKPVHFEDTHLELVVRKAIDKPDGLLFRHQLLSIVSLDASNNQITNLQGIQHLKNLVELNLRDNLISDISQLAHLQKLQSLNLRGNNIYDLEPLAQLTNLVNLNLHSNSNIDSIIPLKKLVNLESLILRNVSIKSEISVLQNFTKLMVLNLRNTGITDTSVLGKLMREGALQNDSQRGFKAAVNIRDNPLAYRTDDGYRSLRPYWHNIEERVPLVLPYYSTILPPVFSHTSGFYSENFLLELSSKVEDVHIHYTLDGSDPTRNSPIYTGSIPIYQQVSDGEYLKDIYEWSSPPFIESKYPAYQDWEGPIGNLFRANIVRAKAFDSQYAESSPTVTSTYFVDKNTERLYSLPVISLSTNPDYLFDQVHGIYVLGKEYDVRSFPTITNLWYQPANYHLHGIEWERPVHINLIEPGEKSGLSQIGAMRIHGGASRGGPYKSLRVYARSEYSGSDIFHYPLFPGLVNQIDSQPILDFNSFMLSNSGNDYNSTLFRDTLMQSLVDHTSLDTQASRPVIVFINGDYWGIYTMRQNQDELYFSQRYNIDPKDVVILDETYSVYRGTPGDEAEFYALLEFIEQNNLQEEMHYQHVQTWLDIDNFLYYQVAEIYFANTDWPSGNKRLWRKKTEHYEPDALPGQDGRWRWILYDTDHGFGLKQKDGSYANRTLEDALEPVSTHRELFLSLLANGEFKIDFINRMADHLNTSFKEERVLEQIEQIYSMLQPEIEGHIQRWRVLQDSQQVWEENVDLMREFARKRPSYMRQHMVEYFDLPGTAALSLYTDSEKGYVKVNTISITSDTPGVDDPSNWTGEYFMGVPIRVTAVPYPGYQFAGWQGLEQDTTEPEITLTLTENLSITANFIPLQ